MAVVKRLAELALAARVRELHGDILDEHSRARELRQVTVPTVGDAELGQAVADFREGSGGELADDGLHRPKLHSAFSSAGLVVNAFGPWRLTPERLEVGGYRGFASLRFERQCPIFSGRATAPNLDVRLDDDELLAIESKLTEFLSGDHEAQFSDRYAASVEELADDHWRRAYHQLRDEPNQFRYLNAAQLVKHYLGLRRCFGDRRATLMYAFWEPANADEHEAFRLHREEIERFASLVAGGNIHFTSIDYSSLWESWASDEPTADHVHRLRERYLINLSTEDLR